MSVTPETATRGQREAFDTIVKASKSFGGLSQVIVINGPAGTGKTSLLRMVEDAIGTSIVTAPTGKAALRVREATACDAATYHKTLFKPRKDDRTGEVEFILKEAGEIPHPESGIWIGDESSMVDEDLFNETLEMCQQKGLNLVLLGDAFQLPPVAGSFNVLSRRFKDAFAGPLQRVDLDEVMRQALDSYVLRSSVLIRQNRMFDALELLPSVPESELLNKAERVLAAGGAVICHTNRKRHELNRALRARRGYDGGVQSGEPLLVLRNNYHVDLFNGEGTTFGSWVMEPRGPYAVYDRFKKVEGAYMFGRALVGEGGEAQQVVLCPEEIAGTIPETGVSMSALGSAARHNFGRADPYLHANFGYVLTAHKSQGSEWPEVLVVAEPTINASSFEGRRWLYTAITRAKKDVTICMLQP